VLLKPSEKKLYFCDYIFRLDRWRLKGTHTHTHIHALFFTYEKVLLGFSIDGRPPSPCHKISHIIKRCKEKKTL
jgi:hypothetical protein